jgi:SOS-response transcriptional repressor LexA
MKPTKKQTALLNFIEKFTEENNYSPSYREIQRALKLNSVSAVAEHISNCEKAGFLEKVPHEARSLRIIHHEEHPETAELFRTKLAELNQKVAELDPTDPKVSQLTDDIATLKSAAYILHLSLK